MNSSSLLLFCGAGRAIFHLPVEIRNTLSAAGWGYRARRQRGVADSSIELRSSEINERISASVAVIRVEGRPLKCTKVKARESEKEKRRGGWWEEGR